MAVATGSMCQKSPFFQAFFGGFGRGSALAAPGNRPAYWF
jgi:hypothetical protein